jgi:cytoskeletal protein CcmA (bactofilin family)
MRKTKDEESISTLLGAGCRIEGGLEFSGTIRIDGQVTGTISSQNGTLIIGERARIDARVDVGVAVVKGHVNGSIDAKERIEIFAPGCIQGDIQAPSISIENGVIFNGNCRMQKTLPTPAPAKPEKALEPSLGEASEDKKLQKNL